MPQGRRKSKKGWVITRINTADKVNNILQCSLWTTLEEDLMVLRGGSSENA